MDEPRCIRYFSYAKNANLACELLKREGFECYVREDKFEELTLDKLGMRRRFRLYVERDDINKIAKILAEKMSEARLR